MSELSGLAISLGPGSFTGLRVGLSVAKALCWSNRIPLMAIPTFEILAFQTPDKTRPAAVITQATQGEILGGVYQLVDSLPVLNGNVFVANLENLSQRIPIDATVLRLGEKPEVEDVYVEWKVYGPPLKHEFQHGFYQNKRNSFSRVAGTDTQICNVISFSKVFQIKALHR